MTTFTCEFCNKTFKRERTIASHACEPRRRMQSKGETSVQIAFSTFGKFYRRLQGSGAKEKSFQDFIKSSYYSAFIRFGEYCVSVNCISVIGYADYVIKNEIPVDKWNTDTIYSMFLQYYIQIEPLDDALERSVKYSMTWATENNMDSYDFFRKASTFNIISSLQSGRVSPWVLYQSGSGMAWIQQTTLGLSPVWDMIEPDMWGKVFEKRTEDVEFARSALILGGW